MFVAERCFEGTRAFSTQGIDKAVFNLFKMYAQLGERRVSLQSSGAQDVLAYSDMWGAGAPPDVTGFATLAEDDSLRVLVFSHHDQIEVSGELRVQLELANLPGGDRPLTLKHYRIDAHTQQRVCRMGAPGPAHVPQRWAVCCHQGPRRPGAARAAPASCTRSTES